MANRGVVVSWCCGEGGVIAAGASGEEKVSVAADAAGARFTAGERVTFDLELGSAVRVRAQRQPRRALQQALADAFGPGNRQKVALVTGLLDRRAVRLDRGAADILEVVCKNRRETAGLLDLSQLASAVAAPAPDLEKSLWCKAAVAAMSSTPELVALTLDGNGLTSLYNLASEMGNAGIVLDSLSLQRNDVNSLEELAHLRPLHLRHMLIAGNPLCRSQPDEHMLRCVRELLPSLVRLDGVDAPPVLPLPVPPPAADSPLSQQCARFVEARVGELTSGHGDFKVSVSVAASFMQGLPTETQHACAAIVHHKLPASEVRRVLCLTYGQAATDVPKMTSSGVAVCAAHVAVSVGSDGLRRCADLVHVLVPGAGDQPQVLSELLHLRGRDGAALPGGPQRYYGIHMHLQDAAAATLAGAHDVPAALSYGALERANWDAEAAAARLQRGTVTGGEPRAAAEMLSARTGLCIPEARARLAAAGNMWSAWQAWAAVTGVAP